MLLLTPALVIPHHNRLGTVHILARFLVPASGTHGMEGRPGRSHSDAIHPVPASATIVPHVPERGCQGVARPPMPRHDRGRPSV